MTKKKKKGQKRHLLVNNLFNIFCNVKMVFNIYYRSKVLQVLRKNLDFFKVGTFEILYLYLSCYKTICCCSQTGPQKNQDCDPPSTVSLLLKECRLKKILCQLSLFCSNVKNVKYFKAFLTISGRFFWKLPDAGLCVRYLY